MGIKMFFGKSRCPYIQLFKETKRGLIPLRRYKAPSQTHCIMHAVRKMKHLIFGALCLCREVKIVLIDCLALRVVLLIFSSH